MVRPRLGDSLPCPFNKDPMVTISVNSKQKTKLCVTKSKVDEKKSELQIFKPNVRIILIAIKLKLANSIISTFKILPIKDSIFIARLLPK